MHFIHPSLSMIKRRPIKSSTSASATSLSAFTTSVSLPASKSRSSEKSDSFLCIAYLVV